MNHVFSLKDHDEQRQKAEQLVTSGNSEEVLRAFWKPEDRNNGNSSGPSKYSRILSCSFLRGPEKAISLETMEDDKN